MTASVRGVDALPVVVEVALASALPSFTVVGLPRGAVREGRERVAAALRATGFALPPKRITVNLSPGDLPKEGTSFDLPIAIGILAADGVLPATSLPGVVAIGEVGLDGALRAVRGALPVAAMLGEEGADTLIVPEGSGAEAAWGTKRPVYVARTLGGVVRHLRGEERLPRAARSAPQAGGGRALELSDVRGQAAAKRALTIAAAGGHNLLLVGPPGAGKTMLARRLPGLLPPLTEREALEVARVRSVCEPGAGRTLVTTRPFRAPHHTCSYAAMVGGGRPLRPGEVSRAHLGVLFLDELPEFARNVVEALRQPLEDGEVVLSRATGSVRFPSRVQLVIAMNPCPCGFAGSADGCRCDPLARARYRRRLSGPLLDRIDLVCPMQAVLPDEVLDRNPAGATTSASADLVRAVRARRAVRIGRADATNASLTVAELREACTLDEPGHRLMRASIERMHLSARGVHRTLRVARTIADLHESERIAPEHLAEALHYRPVDFDS